MIWSFIAAGNLRPGAEAELTRSLAALLADPRYGTGHSSLVIGPGPSVSALHIPAPERVPETTAA